MGLRQVFDRLFADPTGGLTPDEADAVRAEGGDLPAELGVDPHPEVDAQRRLVNGLALGGAVIPSPDQINPREAR